MNKTVVSSPALGEQFLRVEHPSGLTILLCPMEGFSTAYAMFAAKVGSIDTTLNSPPISGVRTFTYTST